MNSYLQVDLLNNSIITAIATQGVQVNGNLALRYKLNYSCDGKAWFDYQQGKVISSHVSCMFLGRVFISREALSRRALWMKAFLNQQIQVKLVREMA